MNALGSIKDPYSAFIDSGMIRNTNGRIARPSRINPNERTMVFVGIGQSNIAASENSTYTPTNTGKVDNYNLYDGGIYAAQDPLLGTGLYMAGGCWLSRFADKLIDANICDRVILVPIARGSTTVQDWQPTGFMNVNLIAINNRLASSGLTPTAYLWAQGEANRFSITREAYRSALSSVIDSVRSQGWNAPWLLGKSTHANNDQDDTIRLAIDDLVNNTNIFAGGDHDTIDNSARYDTVHFNSVGANLAANLWRDAVQNANLQ